MTREEFDREFKKYEDQMRYWEFVPNGRLHAPFVYGYYYDRERRKWVMYETGERFDYYEHEAYDTEEEALDDLMSWVEFEADQTRRLRQLKEKRRLEEEKARLEAEKKQEP